MQSVSSGQVIRATRIPPMSVDANQSSTVCDLAIAPATTVSATTAGARLRLVDANRAAFDLASVQLRDGRVGSLIRGHLDETEAARSVSRPVHDYLGIFDLTGL